MAEGSEEQSDTKNLDRVESSQGGTETGDDDDTVETESEDGEEEDDEEDEEEEEPKLKYARMTSHLGPVYRNGDATSTFLVAGDKMFVGTHNGNIHVLSLPSFKSIRTYHAHSASITSISISPFPPPLPTPVPEAVQRFTSRVQPEAPNAPQRAPSMASQASANTARSPGGPVVPKTPSNAIYIGTSSVDGKVCIASLVDVKDVQLRDFARPVQAVSLSPDYKNDRSYVSGGLAGNLVLTVGGKAGTSSTSTTTGSAAATASGWLGTIGLGTHAGKDTVLHSGEGTINTIKWSLSGRYVAWSNEHGIKIMRSHLQLDSADTESAWKRIGHIPRPDGEQWEDMASVWKARVEWIDEKTLETDEDDKAREASSASPATAKLRLQASRDKLRIEKLVVGWGGTIWMINVHPGGTGVGKNVGERTVGSAEIIKMLRMDCIISGLSLYTPTLLVVLAYVMPDDDEEEEESIPPKGHKSHPSTGSEPSGGIRRRQNALSPELRLIDLATSQEVDTDGLTVSRYERLSAGDYHLCVLPAARDQPVVQSSRGTLEALTGMGSGMWNATINATALLSSSASVISNGSTGDGDSKHASIRSKATHHNRATAAHPHIITPGMKIFIQSPYDCILATKRDLSDHLAWLLEHEKHQEAWELIDEHPEVISSSPEKLSEIGPATPDRTRSSSDDFYDNESTTIESASRLINSSVEKEKRRIGELWIQSLIENDDWISAGRICGKVLGTSDRWEHWVWTFAGKDKFDEITNFIPTAQITPPLPSTIYEIVLGHYITHNLPRVGELLDQWSPDLFDIKAVATALENQLKYRDVRQDSVEDGKIGRDWRIVMESLGKLYVADGRPREALKCYMKLQDADTAMGLIKQYHLVDAVADDLPSLIMLRVSKEQKRHAPISELKEATSEAIQLLVDEAHHGLVRPQIVVDQLEEMPLYLFFYVSSLWKGDGIDEIPGENRDRLLAESRSLVDGLADLALQLFATYDRDLLMEFLKSSTFYSFEKATLECENHSYIPELVYLYSKTGQTKRALYLIIDRLADVSQAISFAKSQNDADLWDDLLEYSMDKPRFIRGLLEEVGTAIDPIRLVRKIPEGLEIEGLREGLSRMIKEYEIQESISQGVARVLRGEVAMAQNTLRAGQRRGVKFDVAEQEFEVDNETQQPPTRRLYKHKPAHCISCKSAFYEGEMETLVGFACGHVWHLSHLLNYGKSEDQIRQSADAERHPTYDGFDDGEDERRYTNVHSIGTKVTRARLLKDRIRGGCPVCKDKGDGAYA